jgi:hypothetical protein
MNQFKSFVAGHGDMIISEPMEIHAMRTGEHGCTFIAFAEGPRGGEDYESDTYRVDNYSQTDEKKELHLIFGHRGGIGSATRKLFLRYTIYRIIPVNRDITRF